jgi:hypothetical protein
VTLFKSFGRVASETDLNRADLSKSFFLTEQEQEEQALNTLYTKYPVRSPTQMTI